MKRALLLLALVACKEKAATPAAGSGSGSAVAADAAAVADAAVVVDVAPAIDAAAAAAAATPAEFLITNDGIGAFDAKTPDDEAAIKKLAAGFTVDVDAKTGEDHDLGEYTLMAGKAKALFMIVDRYRSGDKMFRIEAFDPRFKTAEGIGPGSTVEEAAAKYADLECVVEKYDPDGDIYRIAKRTFCLTKKLPNIAFELENKFGGMGKLPIAKAAKAKLASVGWVNPPAKSDE